MNGDTVALYSLGVSTAVNDGEEGSVIPRVLSVGSPHPNPFNSSQLIPVSAQPGKRLTVEVFNLPGQKVAEIFDGRVSNAYTTIRWKAEGLASGIYLIRATSDDETVKIKSILPK